jgi:hypothetical protein
MAYSLVMRDAMEAAEGGRGPDRTQLDSHGRYLAEVCSNYRPVTRMDRVLTFFGIEREPETKTKKGPE